MLWVVSRVCEEFPGLTPPEAVALLENDTVLELRAFKGAYDMVQAVADGSMKVADMPMDDEMVQAVYDIEFELAREAIEKAKNK
jgi:hypothetical protein